MEAVEKVTLERHRGWAEKDREITWIFLHRQKKERKIPNIFSIFPSWQYSQTRPQLHAWLHRSTLKKPNLQRPFLFNSDPFVSVWLGFSNYITEYLMHFYITYIFTRNNILDFHFFFLGPQIMCFHCIKLPLRQDMHYVSPASVWLRTGCFNVCKCAAAFHTPLLMAASPSTMATSQRPGSHISSTPASSPVGMTLMKHTAKTVPPSGGHGGMFSTSRCQLDKTIDFHTWWLTGSSSDT